VVVQIIHNLITGVVLVVLILLVSVAIGQSSATLITQAAILSSESKITFGLLVVVGTVVGGGIGSWIALRILVAKLEERLTIVCQRLDRLESLLDKLRNHDT
jgi:uncharacterized membrane protein YciS (DUF1049 family)